MVQPAAADALLPRRRLMEHSRTPDGNQQPSIRGHTATESKETTTENKDERRKTKEDRKLPMIPINSKPIKKEKRKESLLCHRRHLKHRRKPSDFEEVYTGKLGSKPIETPIEVKNKLEDSKDDDMAVDRSVFQRLMGKLIYLSHIRPDVAYVVGVVSQFMHNPNESHLRVVVQILQYLKGTPGKGILFRRDGNLTLERYTNADYVGSIIDRRSTSGYFTFFGGNLVIWRSKKQNVVAR
ncbi:uncharacterized mitochondrial protein AtMg00810-like [Hibiscus syriacus]|uniref:uncharacterized mitochondrial protein AtMg00810-like n=1 Tax=Hibiscus syriacus TaxID=106335 RepID=UPI001923417A|nr:uncharacterized mitochondrial protein AtMg00810-like [Hibiscus syriacus]